MVGQAVSEHCRSLGDTVLPYDHQSLDIANLDLVLSAFEREKPEIVINCAAWTDVDGCEGDSDRAYRINACGPENLAVAVRQLDAAFITISTDYVFDGTKDGFYTQRDNPNPQSVYAASKREGELRAQAANAATIVVRTGYIFGPGGKNFLSTIVKRARAGETLVAISDTLGTPTYSRDLAKRLRELGELNLPGLYHVVNSGAGVSFDEFAQQTLVVAGCNNTAVQSISMASLNRPAPRPRNSRLRCLLSDAIGLSPMPNWRDALVEFVQRDRENNSVKAVQ
jgi:dTDP-4-dehydrorhamnose reductase